MWEFLVLTSPFVYIPLIILFLITETILFSNEKEGWTAFIFIAFLLILQMFADVKPLSFIWNNPGTFFVGVGLYGVIGVVFAVIKWFSYVHLTADAIKEKYDEAIRGVPVPASRLEAEKQRAEYFKRATNSALRSGQSWPLQVRDNKGRITAWFFYWPVALIAAFFGDFLSRIGKVVFARLSYTLQGIADRADRRLQAQIHPVEPPPPANPPGGPTPAQ